ncbi:MAG: flagellar hook assembly protein FlgD [Pseudodesulfovibrio sp.]|nr:flagellar hook assembly protein FlgD [Pseudodesulfovibrio sp.]
MTIEGTSYYDSLLQTQNTSVAVTTDEKSTSLTSDDFLTLLVTELEYQDPTEPMNNAEMVNQLTQYSQLDELAEMNDKFDTLTASMNAMTATNGLEYLGKQVEANGYTVNKSGDDISSLSIELGAYAESMTVNIYDENGSIVNTENFIQTDAGTHSYTWDGTDFNGNTVDDGNYYVLVSAENSSGATVDANTTTTGTVTGISTTSDGVVFNLDDGRTVNMADVTYATT